RGDGRAAGEGSRDQAVRLLGEVFPLEGGLRTPHLQITVPLAATATHRRGALKPISPHWPVVARGASMTIVTSSGRPPSGMPKLPFLPVMATEKTPGCEARPWSVTLLMPWISGRFWPPLA